MAKPGTADLLQQCFIEHIEVVEPFQTETLESALKSVVEKAREEGRRSYSPGTCGRNRDNSWAWAL